MSFILRPEAPEDHRAVERLTKEAFAGMDLPGHVLNEHLLAHKLRKSESFVPELDYVAVEALEGGGWGQVVGNILYSRAKIINDEGKSFTVLTFGPLSVKPAWQGRGVGGALVRLTANEAKLLRYRAILIYGHPGYYPRFGFKPARQFGITASDGSAPTALYGSENHRTDGRVEEPSVLPGPVASSDALMAYECLPGSLQGVSGTLHLDPVYDQLTDAELAEFDFALEKQLDPPQ